MSELTLTLQQLRRDICTELQMPFFKRYNGPGAVDTGSTSTLVKDAQLTQTDDFWAAQWFYHVPTQTARYINTFLANTDTLVLENATPSMADNDAYEIHAIWNAYDIHRAINRVIEMDGKAFPETAVDETNVLQEDKLQFDLTTLAKKPWIIAKIWLERATSVMRGTATGGAVGSITDAYADFTGVTNTYKASIYAGTGAGQVRSVSSLTGTHQVNVTPNWTTAPDATSKYAVWNPDRQIYDWFRLTSVHFDAKEFPDKLFLRARYPSLYGMRVRLEYIVTPTVLSAETDTTIVPREYIIARACSILHGQAIGDNRFNRDLHYAESVRYQQRADEVMAKYHPHVPDMTIWEEQDASYPDLFDPLGWRGR